MTALPERTWTPGDPLVLPDLPDSAYPPGAVPLPEPQIMSRTPWSAACAIRHDHGPGGCDGSGPRGACGCPCHVWALSDGVGVLRALAVDAETTDLDRETRVEVARHLIRLAAALNPATLASHAGEGEEAREVRRLGRALLPAARLHADTTREGDDRG